MNIRSLVLAAGAAFFLGFPPAKAVTITQTHTQSFFQIGSSNSANIGYDWFYAPAQPGLVSVDVSGVFDISIQGGFNASLDPGRYIFMGPTTQSAPPFPFAFTIGSTSGTISGHYSDPSSLQMFSSQGSRFMFSDIAYGGFGFSNIVISANTTISLTFNFADAARQGPIFAGQSVAAPDLGASAVLLVASVGICAVAHRRKNRSRPTL